MIWALMIFLGASPETAVVGFHTKAECQAVAARGLPRLKAVSPPADRARLHVGCYRAMPLSHGDPRST